LWEKKPGEHSKIAAVVVGFSAGFLCGKQPCDWVPWWNQHRRYVSPWAAVLEFLGTLGLQGLGWLQRRNPEKCGVLNKNYREAAFLLRIL